MNYQPNEQIQWEMEALDEQQCYDLAHFYDKLLTKIEYRHSQLQKLSDDWAYLEAKYSQILDVIENFSLKRCEELYSLLSQDMRLKSLLAPRPTDEAARKIFREVLSL
jgi:hypothetical protein